MKKKLQFMNFGLMLAVLFAVCYQSVHAFSHSIKQDSEHDHSHSKSNKNLIYKISEKEDCPVCDFKFAAFLSPEVLQIDYLSSFNRIPYQFNSNEVFITFKGNSFYLRGPPTLV
ncbi:hypothetical protein [uncultured Flavobacterium sp.]|uniref:hypothetical protein n=1 Tax=uncultured Flavobacterium sp. TaxID=165435 RepID=UPI0030C7CE15